MIDKELLKLLAKASNGISVELDRDNELFLDLNTMMKSHAHLYPFLEPDCYVIKMRYDRVERIDVNQSVEGIMYDISCVVARCMHGREYANYSWLEYMREKGIITLHTKTIVTYS